MRKLLLLVVLFVSLNGCAVMKKQLEVGRTGSYDKRTKQERQADEQNYWAWQQQYERFKKENYTK